ncbi:extracellular solute-binding protein [Phytohabitans sp. ZYX-F-186]|uniref:Extracellular solute-binding protein n=1 Tax=Phytohabitans maris TaxID=3071409 RepID=A0ABU0Z985_9ACTN|nr:extracellular solute-binding protein [Phytohabitans sp. ZYX-F-186]MDQ7903563.1 extracellular solute-binding protein [Phytohabitans sp. ZYX-F-186]
MATTLSRRGLLSLGVGIGAGTLLAACGGEDSPEAANTRIVARCWGGVWETALQKICPGFTEATGVEVLNDPGSDTVPLLQQKPGQYDLAWLIGNEAARGLTSDVLEPIDTSRIEKWDSIVTRLSDGQTKDGKVSGVPISYTASGILYKTDKVPFKITSWEDLWRPELKGQVALQNAPSIGGLFLIFTGARIFGSGPTDYEAGWKALERLKDNVQFLFNTSTDGVNKLAAGSVAAVVTIADQGIPLKSRGVETVVPAEGSTWSVQNVTIPAASTRKDQAYEFINYMLKDETQVEWAREGKAAPASTTVTLPSEVSANLVETPQIAQSLWPIDWYEFGQNITEWTTRWQRIFGS